eukprot:GHVR01157150.1.p1 GENE.GHVR01157150.1~~GHVR01157150.1.p1  ORF type:complete len:247 (+),score=21.68 GHVR01157150.1:460-1200(+)
MLFLSHLIRTKSTSCKACEKINVRLEKIPAKTAGSVDATKFNQVIYQDLIHLPARSPQGHVYSSVIVDSSTRYVRVHPSRLRLKGWQGLCSLSNLQHVTQSSEVPTISAPADRDSLCDFSSSRTVVPPPPAPDPAPVISRHPFVIARHRNGAVFPAQVLQRSRLQMAALERDTDGKWQHKELLFPNHHSIMKELVGANAEEAFSPSVFEEFLSSAPSASRGDDPEHGLDVPQAGGAEIDAEDAMLP